MCMGAEEGENDFKLTTLMWDVHPERDEEWFRAKTRNLSKKAVAQEYLCSFEGSGSTVVDGEYLKRVKEEEIREPLMQRGEGGAIWVWEEPVEGEEYLAVADVARGDGEDSSALHIFKTSTMEQVLEYNGQIHIDFFPNLLFNEALAYNQALLVVENNNLGYMVLRDLRRMNYPNLFYSARTNAVRDEEDPALPFDAEFSDKHAPGFPTTQNTRPLICSKMEEFIRNQRIVIRSKRTLKELNTFVWKNGRPQARGRNHDDLVMALSIGCWILDTRYGKMLEAQEYGAAMVQAIISTKTTFNSNMPGQVSVVYGHGGGAPEMRTEEEIQRIRREYAQSFLETNKDHLWVLRG